MSLAVRVIPCLDVDAGRVVKGINFKELRDAGDPVELARTYSRGEREIARRLDFVRGWHRGVTHERQRAATAAAR